jgi:hypothetical protein
MVGFLLIRPPTMFILYGALRSELLHVFFPDLLLLLTPPLYETERWLFFFSVFPQVFILDGALGSDLVHVFFLFLSFY